MRPLQTMARPRSGRMIRRAELARYQASSTWRRAEARRRLNDLVVLALAVMLGITVFVVVTVAAFDRHQAALGDPHGYLAAGKSTCHYWAGNMCREAR